MFLKSLNEIIQTASGRSDNKFTHDICELVSSAKYCDGITCGKCPFNTADNIDSLAIELDSIFQPKTGQQQ